VASYLARARGSNEPEFSILRAKALKHFLREIESFKLDYGHEAGHKWNDKINGFRLGLESMLGNRPGSVAIKTEAGTNTNQDKGMGGVEPMTGLSGVV
jgi:SMODS and SLOG-associating 2TM effector domain